jgi:uncharacterized membrane protein
MIKHDFNIEIKAPLEKVFAFTTDLRNLTRWQEGVGEVTLKPDGPTRSDSTFTLVRTFLGQRIEASGAVTEFVPDQRFAIKTTSGPMGLSMMLGYESISGGTRVNIHLEAEPGGFLKLAEGAMERQLTSIFESQVQKLKSILET